VAAFLFAGMSGEYYIYKCPGFPIFTDATLRSKLSARRGKSKEVKMQSVKEKLLQRIEVNPKVMVGKPVIKGTRIPVELILRLLAQGITVEELLEDYPHLAKEDIQAALLYAAGVLADEEVLPIATG